MTPGSPAGIAIYAALWASFALGHSLLASRHLRTVTIRWFGPGERLAYNLVAVVHLAVVLALGRAVMGGDALFDLPLAARVAMWTIEATSLVGVIAVLRTYDLGRLSGMTQWRTRAPDALDAPGDRLITTGLHRYVRHPLYTAVIVLVWSAAISPFGLATAVCTTAYLLVGSHFEERKLIAVHGEAYCVYRTQVPRIVPAIFGNRLV